MPYNTRRKSLSLTELGIVVPKRSRTQSHPSPPQTIAEGEEAPPSKKTKRSHTATTPPPPSTLSHTTVIRVKDQKSKIPSAAVRPSPPPSPKSEIAPHVNRVDVEGIRDDIVVATIRQLEYSGNRPHLVKELATILTASLASVEKYAPSFVQNADVRRRATDILVRSSNPCALISSRLTAYLGRAWPAVSPCPLAKALSSTHPRRLYFHLTTMPRQPIPEISEQSVKEHRVITPSLSSASPVDDDSEDADVEIHLRRRQALSPSPEVDLSAPELDDDEDDEHRAPELPTPGAPFSGRSSVARERSASASAASIVNRGRRAASPQLEREERDFKQTANALLEEAQRRRNREEQSESKSPQDSPGANDSSHDMEANGSNIQDSEGQGHDSMDVDSEETAYERNRQAAAALFGQDHLKDPASRSSLLGFSSPVIAPRAASLAGQAIDSMMEVMSELQPAAMQVDNDAELPTTTSVADPGAPASGTAQPAVPAISALRKQTEFWFSDDSDDWAADLKCPETVGLEELDDMFDAF